MKGVKVVVTSVAGAQAVSLAAELVGPHASAPWIVSIPSVDRVDAAPAILAIVSPLQDPAPPRMEGWAVRPIGKLRKLAEVSGLLGLVIDDIAELLCKSPGRRRSRNVRHNLLRLSDSVKLLQAEKVALVAAEILHAE